MAGWLLTPVAHGAPLGLQGGDVINSIQMDVLQSVSGDGASFNATTGILTANGRWTTVNASQSGAIAQSNVDQGFALDFLVENNNFANHPPFVDVEAFLISPGSQPDFLVTENGVNILFGNFIGNLRISGEVNINDSNGQSLSAVGKLQFTGGAQNLLNALGGASAQANVLISATTSDFMPTLQTLIADNEIFNSNFTVSISGTLVPLNAQPFVPEPSTMVLMGGGFLGLLAVSRRARARRMRH